MVDCLAVSGVCIPIEGQGFDFHFTSVREEQPGKRYEYAHKMSFRPDLIAAMERCGQLPLLEDNVKQIEDKDKMISDQAKALKELK